MSTIAANLQPLTAENFHFMRDLLRRLTAIVLADGKEYLVETRLAPIATRNAFGSVNDLIASFKSAPTPAPGNALHQAIEALTTNETLFFRDLAPFEALRTEIIPAMAERAAGRPLEIWSAACSTGQEPYSLAMLFAEHFPQLPYRIVATDIATKVLDKARAGVFAQHEVNRGLPAKMLIKHFRQERGDWIIQDHIKKHIEFRQLNLLDSWIGLPNCDLVLMRNVLIYFDVETRRDILQRVRRLMRPSALLALGGAETTVQIDNAYEPVTHGRASFYRVS